MSRIGDKRKRRMGAVLMCSKLQIAFRHPGEDNQPRTCDSLEKELSSGSAFVMPQGHPMPRTIVVLFLPHWGIIATIQGSRLRRSLVRLAWTVANATFWRMGSLLLIEDEGFPVRDAFGKLMMQGHASVVEKFSAKISQFRPHLPL